MILDIKAQLIPYHTSRPRWMYEQSVLLNETILIDDNNALPDKPLISLLVLECACALHILTLIFMLIEEIVWRPVSVDVKPVPDNSSRQPCRSTWLITIAIACRTDNRLLLNYYYVTISIDYMLMTYVVRCCKIDRCIFMTC